MSPSPRQRGASCVRSLPAPAALVAISATTVILSLVGFAERPAGVGLLEGADRPYRCPAASAGVVAEHPT